MKCLGSYKYPQRHTKALLGALEVLGGPWRSSEGPKGPDLVSTATGWSNWVGNIHIMCSGLLRDLYGTPGPPKRARFCPKRGPQRAPGGQTWSRLPPISSFGLDSWSPHTLTWYRTPSGPTGALNEPVLAHYAPFGALGGETKFGPNCPGLVRLGWTHVHHTL